jgi:hypothetical protein
METQNVIRSQYLAALEMLRQAITRCPESLWDGQADRNRFWHVAYHVLFYTHLYLQPGEADFRPWAKHRKEYNFLGPLPWPPHKEPDIGAPYSQEEVLEYFELCRQEVEKQVPALDLDAESGFSWLPMGKLELQFYNVRHIQQHTGELMERLGSRAQVDVDWVGKQPQGPG